MNSKNQGFNRYELMDIKKGCVFINGIERVWKSRKPEAKWLLTGRFLSGTALAALKDLAPPTATCSIDLNASQ